MLFVFVEGPDDDDFITKVFGCLWSDYKVLRYAQQSKSWVNSFIKSITSMPNSNYLFFADEDGMGVEQKRNHVLTLYDQLTPEKIVIVQYEIESWYYAGVTPEFCKKLKIKHYQNDTNSLTKEQFCNKLTRISDKKYIMQQMLSNYALELAESRNNSLKSFVYAMRGSAAV